MYLQHFCVSTVFECRFNLIEYVCSQSSSLYGGGGCPWIPACINEASQQHTLTLHSVPIRPRTPRETRAGAAAAAAAVRGQEMGGGLGIMRGCARTDEEGAEEERWNTADYILFLDIHIYK